MSGAKERPSRRGRVRCASASTGRWVRTGGERRGVFQLSGMRLGAKRVHRARLESGALALSGAGKDLRRRAEAGSLDVGEEMSLSPTIHPFCERRTVSGGRHSSPARIGTAVDRKQLMTPLCNCRPWTSILLRYPLVGVNRSAPYERIGNIKQWASQWDMWGETPLPASERRRTEEKASWDSGSRRDK